MIQTVTDNNFDEIVLKNDKLVLVDFWADWCGPCKMLLPIITNIAEELKDKIVVSKIDIDANQNIPSQLGVRSIPTLMLFKDGKNIATKVGLHSKDKILEWINENN